MGAIFRRVRKHPSSSELILLKSTGDGFLAVYQSIPAAFSLARTYLEQPLQSSIQFRMALHWGTVNTGPDGDILGTEVRRIFRVENMQKEDCVAPTASTDADFSAVDRILATKPVIDRLPAPERSQFHQAGTFRLNHSGEGCCDLWVWHAQHV
jgi:class 3 adenylate cyclase